MLGDSKDDSDSDTVLEPQSQSDFQQPGILDLVNSLGLYRGMCVETQEFKRAIVDVGKIKARLIKQKDRKTEEHSTSSLSEFKLSQTGCMSLKDFGKITASSSVETTSSHKAYVCKYLVIHQEITFDDIAPTQNVIEEVEKCLESTFPKVEYQRLEKLYGSVFPTQVRLGGCFYAWSTDCSESAKFSVQSTVKEFTETIDSTGQVSSKLETKSTFVETKKSGGDIHASDPLVWFKSLDDPVTWAAVEFSGFVSLRDILPENLRKEVDKHIYEQIPRARASTKLRNALLNLKSKTIRIGVFGKVASGKSSLCNTFISLFDPTTNNCFKASESFSGSYTQVIQKYSVEVNGGYLIEIVDFPGIISNDLVNMGNLVSTAEKGGFSEEYNLRFYPNEREFIRQRQYGNVARWLPLEYFFGKANIVPQNDRYNLDAIVYVVKPPDFAELDERIEEMKKTSGINEFKNSCKGNRFIVCFTHFDRLSSEGYEKLKSTFEDSIFVSCLMENRMAMAEIIENAVIEVIRMKSQAEKS